MFGSEIIDVVIGMIFVFLTLSLICSAVNEIIEAWLNKRADYLERGIKELLTDKDGSGYTSALYSHPLIAGLFRGDYGVLTEWRKNSPVLARILHELGFKAVSLPSYIPARNFASALMDIVKNSDTSSPSDSKANAEKAVKALIAAGEDSTKVRENIENWFNGSMDRVSGWYKRRTQVIILLLGFLITIFLNADSIAISKSLSSDKALRSSLVASAQEYAKADASNGKPDASPSPAASPSPVAKTTQSPSSAATPQSTAAPSPSTDAKAPESCKENKNAPKCKLDANVQKLENLGLPIGWDRANPILVPPLNDPGAWLLKLFGWLITAFAISLGAPFWFDLLNQFMVVRSTVKPKEKSPEEPAKPGND